MSDNWKERALRAEADVVSLHNQCRTLGAVLEGARAERDAARRETLSLRALSPASGVEPGPALRTFGVTAGELPAQRHLLAVAVERLKADETRAQAACDRAMAARAHHPVGSSRARVTTLNARWASAAEHRDRVRDARALAEQLLARAHEVSR